eukprot:12900520-Prorocentrum_lima.AAC.1
MGYWWVGSTWFKMKKVDTQSQSPALDGLFASSIQRALLIYPEETCAMWGSGGITRLVTFVTSTEGCPRD